MTDEKDLETEAQRENDEDRQATVDMTVNGGADYQAQIDAVEAEREREQEIIRRNREQVEERRRARYEQQDDRTSSFDKKEIESERKDLSYSRSPNDVEFAGGNDVTTFNGIQYPKQEDTKREASVPIMFGDDYTAPKRTPPAYNPGSYSILGKNYSTSQKQRSDVQKSSGKFMQTPAFKTLYAQHKENALQQGRIFDFMNPSPEKVSEVRAAGVYNPFSGKSESSGKRIKENQESYSILGSKYFSSTKAGETQRKKVQTKAEAFQGTTQFANRLGMIFSDVGTARTEREEHEALVAKAEGKKNAKVGTDSLSQYIPKVGLSGGLSYLIPQTFSTKRKDETKEEGGTKGVPVKDRKTGQIKGIRAPASEKFENPPLQKELFKEVDPNKIRHFTKKGNEFNKSQYENYYDKLVGSGKASYPKAKQAAYEIRKEQANLEANEAISKKIPHPKVKYTDMIVEAGLASYVKPKDYQSHAKRQSEREEEQAKIVRREAERLQREERIRFENEEKEIAKKIATGKSTIKRYETLSKKLETKRTKAVSQITKNKAETEQRRLKGVVAQIRYNTGLFEEEIGKKKKEKEAHEKANPKWLAKRAATISRNAETESLREKAYRKNTPVLNQVTDMLGGKGKKPYNFKPDKGEGGLFDKKVKQPVFDAQGNEIGEVTKKENVFKVFEEKHPIMASLGSSVKQGAMQPLRDLEAGRKARAAQQKVGFLYGGGLQPVNITQKNPEGEFPKKTGRTASPKRKDRIGGTELSFFGKPFGAPKAPRRTRRGKIIKMTPAQRKRAARRPKTFLDDVFGGKW